MLGCKSEPNKKASSILYKFNFDIAEEFDLPWLNYKTRLLGANLPVQNDRNRRLPRFAGVGFAFSV